MEIHSLSILATPELCLRMGRAFPQKRPGAWHATW